MSVDVCSYPHRRRIAASLCSRPRLVKLSSPNSPGEGKEEKRRFRGVDAAHGPAADPAIAHHVACTCDVLRRRFMGRNDSKTGDRPNATRGLRPDATREVAAGSKAEAGWRDWSSEVRRAALRPWVGPQCCPPVNSAGSGRTASNGPTSTKRSGRPAKAPPRFAPEPLLLFSCGRFCPAVSHRTPVRQAFAGGQDADRVLEIGFVRPGQCPNRRPPAAAIGFVCSPWAWAVRPAWSHGVGLYQHRPGHPPASPR